MNSMIKSAVQLFNKKCNEFELQECIVNLKNEFLFNKEYGSNYATFKILSNQSLEIWIMPQEMIEHHFSYKWSENTKKWNEINYSYSDNQDIDT